MDDLSDLPDPPPGVGQRHKLYVDVWFRGTACPGSLTITPEDGVVVHLPQPAGIISGARSITHASPQIAVEETMLNHFRWLLVESADGWKAAVRTGMSIEKLRLILATAGVQAVEGGPGLRDKATRLLDRPRPPDKHL
jgi:hypothetical protein